jgi:non-heme chloroperoxidase
VSNVTVMYAVIKKDVLSLFPLMLLTAMVQVLHVIVPALDILPQLALYLPFIWFFATTLLIFAIFQLDAPASIVDDWLCRPVPRRVLLLSKLVTLFGVIYVTRLLAMFVADLGLGYGIVESLQEAVLLQMNYELVAFPLIMIAAIVSSTVIQGLAILLAVLILIIMIPSSFIGESGPLEPGFADALSENGMLWMSNVLPKCVAIVLTTVSFWMVYRHRHIMWGRVMLFVSTGLAVLTVFLPLAFSWDKIYAFQKTVAPEDAVILQNLASRLSLNHVAACFPATTVGALTDDTVFKSAQQTIGLAALKEEWIAAAGSSDMTFMTRVEPRGVPRDLHLKLAYVQARYTDETTGTQLALRPAEYLAHSSPSVFGHQWLLPRAELQRLLEGKPAFELTYSMSVLKPLTHSLEANGARRDLAGVGYCGARHDEVNNRIVVDCFNGGVRPALISAELMDVSATRVESELPDFSPPLIQLPGSSRVELNVERASLVKRPIVEVTGWQLAGFIDYTLKTDGILGNDTAACALPSETAPVTQFTSWKDASPHTAFYLSVAEDVTLEVLDWGGQGESLVLIHGLGATAHTWDDIAPDLARDHRVIAITRRGIGGSSRPDWGYDSATLAQDVVSVLDAMKIDRAVMVGSSIGGQELSWLGAEHPDRVAGLVYLDAAFDYAAQREQPPLDNAEELLPPRPPMLPEDLRSYDTLLQWMRRTDTDPIPEGEMLALYNINNRFLAGNIAGVDMRLLEAIEAGVQSPRYEAITAPVLALFAMPDGPEYFMRPWYDAEDPDVQQLVAAMAERTVALKADARSVFSQHVPLAEVRDIPGASHGMHMSNRQEVVAAIRDFVSTRATVLTSGE